MKTALTPGGWIERLVANLIDTFLLMLGSGMLAAIIGTTDANDELAMPPIGLLLIFLINAAYYTGFTSSKWQATPGKRLMQIYVVRADQRTLTQRDALERFLAYAMPTLPIYASFLPPHTAPFLVIWLSVFWFAPIITHPKRQAVHDRLCGTRVVKGLAG